MGKIPSWERLYEMANFDQNDTGLDEVIYVSVKQGSHGPRLKVFKNKQPKGENFSVTIEDTPRMIGKVFVNAKELKRIVEFITLNKQVLLDYWNFEITTTTLVKELKKI
jgi:predicted RNA-binding protein